MAPLGDIGDHLALVRRMARATGTDLAAAMQQGDLPAADWADMVTNCRGCGNAAGCDRWLTARELDGAPAQGTPDYCANRATFARLGTSATGQG